MIKYWIFRDGNDLQKGIMLVSSKKRNSGGKFKEVVATDKTHDPSRSR